MTTVLIVLQLVAAAGMCGYIASEKNRNGIGWFFLALLFAIPAILALIALPVATRKNNDPHEA